MADGQPDNRFRPAALEKQTFAELDAVTSYARRQTIELVRPPVLGQTAES